MIGRLVHSKKEDKFYKAKKYKLTPIFDRVGAGDAFSAGFISGMLDKKDLKNSLEFATAASALKHSILGDFNLVSKKEVENLLITGTSARVQR